MKILLICEPRSGSTNLANWFYFNKNFTTLFEPIDPKSKWYQKELNVFKYNTKHLCIKEVYYPHFDYTELLNTFDKIIVLYREDYQQQLESFLNSITTNNWDNQYVYKEVSNELIEEKSKYFKQLKTEFSNKFVNENYFTISYEELYYNNGFQKIVDYLAIEEVKNENFPYGKRYRIFKNDDSSKKLI